MPSERRSCSPFLMPLLFFIGLSPLVAPLHAANATTLDPAVPALTPNFSLRGETWVFAAPIQAREPFSYARNQPIVGRMPLPLPPSPRVTPLPTAAELSASLAHAQSLYSSALESSASADSGTAATAARLNDCLAALDPLMADTLRLSKSAPPGSANAITSAHFLAAAERLKAAAKGELERLQLQARFHSLVLQAPAFQITAIQAADDNTTDPTAAVQFAGYPRPFNIGDRIQVLDTDTKRPRFEVKILAISRTTVTILFDRHKSFEIPVLLNLPAADNLPADKH